MEKTWKRSIKSLSFSENCRLVKGRKRNLPTRLGVLLLKGDGRQKRELPVTEENECIRLFDMRMKKSGTTEIRPFRLLRDEKAFIRVRIPEK